LRTAKLFTFAKNFEYMFFKLMKDLPWMFAVAAIIWVVVLIIFFNNNKKSNDSFFKKHKNTFVAAIIALILTITDIWFFVQYIPTHFRKNETIQTPALSTTDIAKELQTTYTATKTAVSAATGKDTAKKTTELKPVAKIYTTNKASIRFFSSTPAEDIEATNSNTVSALNDKTGDLRFVALIKGFHFENELMQDHFNDKDYMNSDAFPKSEFKGSIINIASVDFTKNGTYNVTATGNLTIHGISKKITAQGSLTVTDGKVNVKSIFKIKRVDYGITTDEIAEALEITVIATFN
jgi:hypothetical protein